MSSEKLLNVMVELRAARRASQTAERQDASREALRDETGELAVAEDEDLGHSSAHRALLSSVHQAKASVAEHKGRLESRDRTISNLQDWVQNVAQRTQTGDLQQLAEEALEGFDADQYEAEDAQHAQQGLGRRSSSAAGLGAELKAHWQSSVDEEALKRATAMHEAWKAEMGMEMAEMSHLRESVRSLKDQLQSSRAEVRQLKFLDRVRKMRSVSESGGASNPDEPQLPEGEGSLPMDLGPSRNSSLGEPMPRSRLAAGGSDQYVRELQAQVANLQQQLQRAMEGGGGANPNPGRPPHPSLPRSRLSDSGCSSSTEATLPKPASAIFSIAEVSDESEGAEAAAVPASTKAAPAEAAPSQLFGRLPGGSPTPETGGGPEEASKSEAPEPSPQRSASMPAASILELLAKSSQNQASSPRRRSSFRPDAKPVWRSPGTGARQGSTGTTGSSLARFASLDGGALARSGSGDLTGWSVGEAGDQSMPSTPRSPRKQRAPAPAIGRDAAAQTDPADPASGFCTACGAALSGTPQPGTTLSSPTGLQPTQSDATRASQNGDPQQGEPVGIQPPQQQQAGMPAVPALNMGKVAVYDLLQKALDSQNLPSRDLTAEQLRKLYRCMLSPPSQRAQHSPRAPLSPRALAQQAPAMRLPLSQQPAVQCHMSDTAQQSELKAPFCALAFSQYDAALLLDQLSDGSMFLNVKSCSKPYAHFPRTARPGSGASPRPNLAEVTTQRRPATARAALSSGTAQRSGPAMLPAEGLSAPRISSPGPAVGASSAGPTEPQVAAKMGETNFSGRLTRGRPATAAPRHGPASWGNPGREQLIVSPRLSYRAVHPGSASHQARSPPPLRDGSERMHHSADSMHSIRSLAARHRADSGKPLPAQKGAVSDIALGFAPRVARLTGGAARPASAPTAQHRK